MKNERKRRVRETAAETVIHVLAAFGFVYVVCLVTGAVMRALGIA